MTPQPLTISSKPNAWKYPHLFVWVDSWRLNLKPVYEENELIKYGLHTSVASHFR